MPDVLSQGEIDALLSAISTGEMSADELREEEAEKKIAVYDFKRALRFSKDQVRSLARIHENFARLLTTSLSAQLRTFVQISVASVDQLPYGEFISSIPKMTLLNIFEAEPLEGRFLIEVHPHIGYAMLDRILGGKGTGVNKVDNLTEIETKILSQLFHSIIAHFQQAWQSIIEIDTAVSNIEVNPQFVQLLSPNETVIVISLSTTIGETTGMINVCLPYVVLEEVLPQLSTHYWLQETNKTRSDEETNQLKKSVRNAHLTLQAVLGKSQLTVEELLHLRRGDVIQLNQSIHESFVTHVGGEPKYFVQAGKRNRHLAVQITEEIREGEGNE